MARINELTSSWVCRLLWTAVVIALSGCGIELVCLQAVEWQAISTTFAKSPTLTSKVDVRFLCMRACMRACVRSMQLLLLLR